MAPKSRNRAYGINNALQKLSSLPITSVRDPNTNDLSHPIGTLWINQTTNKIWGFASVSSGSANWVELSSGTVAPEIEFITGDTGGAVGPDAGHNLNILGGAGIATTGTPGTNTVTISTTATVTPWTREAGAAVPMVIDHGYIPTNAGLTTFTPPAVATVGDYLEVAGEGAGGWTIAQNAGQSIQFGANASTVGVGGSLASTNAFDTVRLVCRVANTTWSVLSNVGVLLVT